MFLLESGGVVIGAVPAVLDLELTCNLGEFTVKKLPMRIMRLLDCSCMPAKESVYDILFEQIVRSRVEAVHVFQLSTESFPWNYMQRSPLIQKLFRHSLPRDPFPYPLIRLDGTFESYLQRLSAKTRKNRLREIRELQKVGDTHLIRITKPSEVDVFLEAAYRIAKTTWQFDRFGRGLAGRDPDLVRSELLFLAQRGWLRSYMLRSGNVTCSFVLGLQYGHRFHAFAAAVDPAWRRYSAGTVIFLLVLEDLFKENPPEIYDFGTRVRSKDYLATESYMAGNIWLFRRQASTLLRSSLFHGCSIVSTSTGAILDRLRLKSRVTRLLWR